MIMRSQINLDVQISAPIPWRFPNSRMTCIPSTLQTHRPEQFRRELRSIAKYQVTPQINNPQQPSPALSFTVATANLERQLYSLDPSGLVEAIEEIAENYLLVEAVASTGNQISGSEAAALEYFQEKLPNSTWYLTFQKATAMKMSRFSHEQLTRILVSLGRLPVQIPAPLPIGFGTPRWARATASTDPEAWDEWLASCVHRFSISMAESSSIMVPDSLECSPEASVSNFTQSSFSRELNQTTAFVVGLACCCKWAMVRADIDWLTSAACLEELQQTLLSYPLPLPDQPNNASRIQSRIAFAMLSLRMSPPRLLLNHFFMETGGQVTLAETAETNSEGEAVLFSTRQLHAMVRGLLYLGKVPPSNWVQPLASRISQEVTQLEPRVLQAFLEGFRYFDTELRQSWLKDAIAILEEFED